MTPKIPFLCRKENMEKICPSSRTIFFFVYFVVGFPLGLIIELLVLAENSKKKSKIHCCVS